MQEPACEFWFLPWPSACSRSLCSLERLAVLDDDLSGIMESMNAYSEDLRKKIVEALPRGTGKSEGARSFGVSLSSVKRYARMAEEGRPLAPKKRPGSRPKIDEGARKLLESDLEERPAATLPQRRQYLQKVAGVR